jgi:hypothetical protein
LAAHLLSLEQSLLFAAIAAALHLVAAEDVILFAGRALCAFQAADQQKRHAHSDQDGHHICMGCEPVDYAMHKACLPE